MYFETELISVVYQQISSISYSFNRNRPTKAEIQNLNFLIVQPIIIQYFAK